MQKVVYISNSRDFTEQNDINNNQYLVRINRLLEVGWVISQMNTQTVEVDPRLENFLQSPAADAESPITALPQIRRLCGFCAFDHPKSSKRLLHILFTTECLDTQSACGAFLIALS